MTTAVAVPQNTTLVRPKSTEPVFLQNVQIMWRNFEGRGSAYNAEGKRNFVIILDDPKVMQDLIDGGWNVKLAKPQEDGSQTAFLPVEANYAGRTPPEVFLVSGKSKVLVPEELLAMVDGVEIKHCDVYFRPYDWKMARGSGRKAYLKTIAIVMADNPIHDKYADMEEVTAVQQTALPSNSSANQTPPAPKEEEEDYPDAVIVEDDEPPY